MEYILNIQQNKSKEDEGQIDYLLEQVLITLKNCQNPEIIAKGNQDKYIKLIWQKDEEQILFESHFFAHEAAFEDPGMLKQIENFLIKALDLEPKQLHSQKIDFVVI